MTPETLEKGQDLAYRIVRLEESLKRGRKEQYFCRDALPPEMVERQTKEADAFLSAQLAHLYEEFAGL